MRANLEVDSDFLNLSTGSVPKTDSSVRGCCLSKSQPALIGPKLENNGSIGIMLAFMMMVRILQILTPMPGISEWVSLVCFSAV